MLEYRLHYPEHNLFQEHEPFLQQSERPEPSILKLQSELEEQKGAGEEGECFKKASTCLLKKGEFSDSNNKSS